MFGWSPQVIFIHQVRIQMASAIFRARRILSASHVGLPIALICALILISTLKRKGGMFLERVRICEILSLHGTLSQKAKQYRYQMQRNQRSPSVSADELPSTT